MSNRTASSTFNLNNNAAQRTYKSTSEIILESWGQGNGVGAIMILLLVLFYKYKSGRLLHKLILLELLLPFLRGTTVFFDDPLWSAYHSATFTLLVLSYQVHNIVSFFKIRPFLGTLGQRIYLGTLVIAQAYWILEIYAFWKFYASNDNSLIDRARPWSPLCREPWWFFTIGYLFYSVKKNYDFGIFKLLRTSPKFRVLTLCMFISIVFVFADLVAPAIPRADGQPQSYRPYWRLALLFKYAADVVFLDDFKTVLDKISAKKFDPWRAVEGSDGVAVTKKALVHRQHSDDSIATMVESGSPRITAGMEKKA